MAAQYVRLILCASAIPGMRAGARSVLHEASLPTDGRQSDVQALSLMQLSLQLTTKTQPGCLNASDRKAAMLSEMRLNPLLREPQWNREATVAPIGVANATGGVVLHAYHKTGFTMASDLLHVLIPRWPLEKRRRIFNPSPTGYYGTPGTFVLPNQKVDPYNVTAMELISANHEWLWANNMEGEWRTPSNSRIVLFTRDPIQLLLSAYRYHARKSEDWEDTLGHCAGCYPEDSKLLFKTCCEKCSYHDLLSNSSELEGMVFEAARSRRQLQDIWDSQRRWMNDKNVLHLSMEHFEKDFNATSSCLLKFLNYSGNVNEVVEELQVVNQASSQFSGKKSHRTKGLHNNTELEAYLETQGNWGKELFKMRTEQNAISQRQWTQYGCPAILH